MKRVIIKYIMFLIVTIAISSTVHKDVKAYNPMVVTKYDATITDNSVNAFGSAYDRYIPAAIKAAFESEGGKVYVIPHNLVDPRVNVSGWSGGSLQNVTGYLDVNVGYPALYANSKTVDKALDYPTETSDKVLVHEIGHYVCLKANKIRNGSYSYTYSPQMQAAFNAEYAGYIKTPGMKPVLVSSFKRNASISEYYANVFAAMVMDPVNAQVAFPNSCACINADISQINAVYGQYVANQAPSAQQLAQAQAIQAQQLAQAQALQAQQLAQAQALQAQQLAQAQAAQQAAIAQALQILQIQATQTQDPGLALQAKQQLALYYSLQ